MNIILSEHQIKTILNEVRYINTPNFMTHNIELGNPIKDDETIRVYHGFYSFNSVKKILKYGLSGKQNADRIYSFEYGNNPYGLFVTIDFNVASKHFSPSGVIIEFSTKVSDLESPVWVGGRSYFVQGEYTKSFKDLEEREQQRLLNRQKSGESVYDAISKSDRPELGESIFNNSERQALYIGDLNPNMIKYVWYNEKLHKERLTDGKWVRYSRKDFIRKFNIETKRDMYDYFLPNDDFSIEKIFKNLNYNEHYKKIDEHNPVIYALKNYNEYGLKDTLHLFPKQIKQVMELRKTNYFENFIEKYNENED